MDDDPKVINHNYYVTMPGKSKVQKTTEVIMLVAYSLLVVLLLRALIVWAN